MMGRKRSFMNSPVVFVFLTFILHNIAYPRVGWTTLCEKWSPARLIGVLNSRLIPEASGLAISRQLPHTLYHVNDSGDGPFVYVTDYFGDYTRTLRIPDFNPQDVEDLAMGPCYFGRSCLIVGDIGDNEKKRTELTLAVFDEKEYADNDTVFLLNTVRVEYPGYPNIEAHDAEAMALHPTSGDLYILTKEIGPAKMYRLKKEQWHRMTGEIQTLTFVGEIDFSKLKGGRGLASRLVTSLDISPDGNRLLALTYEKAFEFSIDLSRGSLKPTIEMIEGVDYRSIAIKPLAQQEAIAYFPNGRDFLYETEALIGSADIMGVECLQ